MSISKRCFDGFETGTGVEFGSVSTGCEGGDRVVFPGSEHSVDWIRAGFCTEFFEKLTDRGFVEEKRCFGMECGSYVRRKSEVAKLKYPWASVRREEFSWTSFAESDRVCGLEPRRNDLRRNDSLAAVPGE